MGTFWPLFLGMILSLNALAEGDRASFNFRGQADEQVQLERVVAETRHRTEMQADTCTRQVPYEAEECGYETRYRQECSWIPAREECGSRDERRCHDVTRYRQECHNGPSRRECRQVPGDQICTTGPSRRDCQTFPGGQVCHNGPSREICDDRSGQEECREVNGQRVCRRTGGRQCRTVPGERICRDAPSETRCREIPGERVCRRGPDETRCHDVPGERFCRQVPYTDQECTSVSVPYCRTIPGENRCEQVPYQEYACRQVTRQRTETYACQRPVQVPYEAQVAVKAQLEVAFLNPEFDTEVPFIAALTPAKVIELSAQAPAGVLVGTRPEAPAARTEGEEVVISQKVNVQFSSKTLLEGQLTQNLSAVVIDLAAKKLSFTAQGLMTLDDSVEVVIEGRKKQLFSTVVGRANLAGQLRVLGAATTAAGAGQSAVQLDLSKTDLSKITDKKDFKLKLVHIKGLPAGFGWSGQVPEVKSSKEAAAQVVR